MRLLAWLDGAVFEAEKLRVDLPFVQQRIHTLNGVIYHLEQHINILRTASEHLFGFASLCGVKDAQRIIGKLLELSRVANSLSVPVVMRLDATGRLSFEVEKPTFGLGGYLRAKREVGAVYTMTQPTTEAETQASVALDSMADYAVRHIGGQRAIWIDGNGYLLSRPWQPIFVYYKRCWFTPKRYNSVEYGVIARAIEAAGYRLYERDIPESALELVDEMFVGDIMGISSFSSVKEHRLLSSITTHIASKMEPKL